MKRVYTLLLGTLLSACGTASAPQLAGKSFTGANATEKYAQSEAAAAEKDRQGRCTDARIALARAQESGNRETQSAATAAIKLHCDAR